MITRLLTIVAILVSTNMLSAQSTNIEVYVIMQSKCASCHSNANPQSGLDLEGEGSTIAERAMDVYANIANITPANDFAADKGYKYIYKGRPDRSFLFRKISDGFENMIAAHADEEGVMPPATSPQLTDYEKEVFRQWILYGAPATGEVVDLDLLDEYYTDGGLEAYPTRPAAPDPSEGFQVKMGPYFIAPGSENEFFLKYEVDLGEAKEINRVHTLISPFSHHFITYKFPEPADAVGVTDGFRPFNGFEQNPIVTSVAQETDIRLPEKTAFKWQAQEVLDLNSHYINFSPDQVFKAEGYVNIYTQEAGTALEQMFTVLVPNLGIYIPNNGNIITETQSINAFGNPFAWLIGGHTHQLGTGYKIWKQTPTGDYGELIYDASCPGGIPGCVSPFFDYAHIPNRMWPEFLKISLSQGVIHEATYVNNSDVDVSWGPLSTDEMMLFTMMYVNDTTGLNINTPGPVDTEDLELKTKMSDIVVFPNPVQDELEVILPTTSESIDLVIYDLLGRVAKSVNGLPQNSASIDVSDLRNGMYLYEFTNERGERKTGKLYKE